MPIIIALRQISISKIFWRGIQPKYSPLLPHICKQMAACYTPTPCYLYTLHAKYYCLQFLRHFSQDIRCGGCSIVTVKHHNIRHPRLTSGTKHCSDTAHAPRPWLPVTAVVARMWRTGSYMDSWSASEPCSHRSSFNCSKKICHKMHSACMQLRYTVPQLWAAE